MAWGDLLLSPVCPGLAAAQPFKPEGIMRISTTKNQSKKWHKGPPTSPCHALYYKKSEERGRTLADEKDRHPPCNKINIKSRLQTVTARCMVSSFCGRLVMQPQIFGCANQKTGTRRKKEKKKKMSPVCYTGTCTL